ncbi:Collectin-10 [Amphibalanus amphitrite]|uniref:Collectin-10 n=1 Tax=Amphibalanus amphitrite TaxID=1232801 RepID=A0A6A4WLA5_AMPAM|nr:Collectin-10 [Amphibalanus amphitrite]
MEELGESNETLPADLVLATKGGVLEPSCRHLCLSRPDCLGTAYRPSDQQCLLSVRRPAPGRLEPAAEPWVLAARRGLAFLDEPCQRTTDCSLVVPGSFCSAGLCACLEAFNRTEAGGCRPLGELVPADEVRPADDALFRVEAAAELADCSAACQGGALCLAVEFSAVSSTCRLYSAGITDDLGADPSGEWRTLVRRLPTATGPPPADFVQLGGQWWFSKHPAAEYRPATRDCASLGGILYHGREDGTRAALAAAQMLDERIFLGLDDTGIEGEFVYSDGEPLDNLTTWHPDEPNNAGGNEDCTVLRTGGLLNDIGCGQSIPYVCMWQPGVLRSAARSRPVWTSWGTTTAARAVDGDMDTWSGPTLPDEVDSLEEQRQHLTVDLGATHQVTAVLLVTGAGRSAADTTIYLSSSWERHDAAAAAVCRRLPGQYMRHRMARLYRCRRPVQGRYLHLVTDRLRVSWTEVAVIGAQLDGDQPLQPEQM